jgi:hypothetical protein
MGKKKELPLIEIEDIRMLINGLDDVTAQEIKRVVFKQWRIRSKQIWKLSIQYLKNNELNPDELQDKNKRK